MSTIRADFREHFVQGKFTFIGDTPDFLPRKENLEGGGHSMERQAKDLTTDRNVLRGSKKKKEEGL